MTNVSDILLNSEEAARHRRASGEQQGDSEFSSNHINRHGRRRRSDVVDVIPPLEETPTKETQSQSTLSKNEDIVMESTTTSPSKVSSAKKNKPVKDSPTKKSVASTSTIPPSTPQKTTTTTAGPSTSSNSSSSLPKSYASIAYPSNDGFTIEFFMGDKRINRDMTIFGTIYQAELEKRGLSDSAGANINVWQQVYIIKYRRVPIPTLIPSATTSTTTTTTTTSTKPSTNTSTSRATTTTIATSSTNSPKNSSAKTSSISSNTLHTKDIISEECSDSKTFSGLDLTSSPGKILTMLRLLYHLNTRWSEFYEISTHSENSSISTNPHLSNSTIIMPPPSTSLSSSSSLSILLSSAFTNNKLTAKLNRQLNEPLIVASHVLPCWCSLLAKHFSFIVPFDTRLTYLSSTSFGYSRSMGRWQRNPNGGGGVGGGIGSGGHRGHGHGGHSLLGGGGGSGGGGNSRNGDGSSDTAHLGRIQRQKVRLSRHRILDSMIKVVELYGSTQALLEVEFFDEVGTGLGPTLEFYSLVCKEIQRRVCPLVGLNIMNGNGHYEKLPVWRDEGFTTLDKHSLNTSVSDESSLEETKNVKKVKKEKLDGYVVAPLGLFPAPMNDEIANSEGGK